MTQQAKLNQVVERLKPYRPKKIILYGSRARGNYREDSDIDLLIVKNTKKRFFARRKEASDLLYKKEYFLNPSKFIRGLDFMIFTPAEIKKALQKGDFFFKEVLEQGKTIYAER